MIELKEWRIFTDHCYPTRYIAAGNVKNHPKCKDGDAICTTWIVSVTNDPENGRILMDTKSGNHYVLSYQEIKTDNDMHLSTRMMLEDLSCDTSWISVAADGPKSLERPDHEEILDKAKECLSNGELLLIMDELDAEKGFFKHDDTLTEICPYVNAGLYQDSVLMLDDYLVDFRYWPREYNHFECYHWSDGLNAVYIFNVGDSEIWYDYKRGDFIACRPGDTIRIEASMSGDEGLISPDAVDGKNALTPDFV